jgi:hypothetical protein
MTRAIQRDDLLGSLPRVLEAVGDDCFVVEDRNGVTVAAIVSPEEFEFIRRKKAEDAIAAMRALGEQLQRVATPEEIDELERALDRKA